ncbi:hypothetical protein [Streptomyces xanthophaeus]|uniref:PepSY domain-containing protein n=1 Tax=Streptomyces xanthophaeus TaxID=67385 RepID=A0A919GT61_9ACTN|nr:hypothetical protein [Streptomyces xanthophaeus]GHI83485.1 hypothetical protein Sxan_08490 [Streptomyces xanthophaeus]
MSESIPPSVQPEQPEQPQQSADRAPAAAENRGRAALGRLVPRSKGARWAVLGAAVVVVGGGVAAVAVAEHHHGRGDRGLHVVRAVPGHGGPGERRLEGVGPGHGREEAAREDGAPLKAGPKERGGAGLHGVPGLRGGSAGTAPAPLPSLAIGDAADKAAAAVTGGKVESLRVVAQEGGGSAWLAVVLGPDGVRHAVTVSGTDGSVSSNTTLDR